MGLISLGLVGEGRKFDWDYTGVEFSYSLLTTHEAIHKHKKIEPCPDSKVETVGPNPGVLLYLLYPMCTRKGP